MTCAELSGSYDTFALGIEEEPVSQEIAAHLRRDCETCVPAVRRALALTAGIGLVAQLVEPPARLRRRILASVQPELIAERGNKGFGWSLLWGAAALMMLCIAVVLGWQMQRIAALRVQEAERLQWIQGVMSDPQSQLVNFGAGDTTKPHGVIAVNRKRGVVVMAAQLPALPEGKTFELWLIPRVADGKPVPSGTFHAGKDGAGVATREGEVWDDIGTVAVTVENEGGVAAPTTTPILAANTKLSGI